MNRNHYLMFWMLCGLISFPLQALQTKELASLGEIPWGMDHRAPDELLIALKSGEIKHLNLSTNQVSSVSHSPLPELVVSGQGGLLDLRYLAEGSWVYVTYARAIEKGKTTALARATYDASKKALGPWQVLFTAKTESNKGEHFGSRLAFSMESDGQGHLYLSIGDRGFRERAQDLSFHNGKIVRLKLDGTVPSDNPFITTKGALPEIWSYGHRNPQGLTYSSLDQKLYSNEHGPRGGDEINLIKKGANYGWPIITYGKEYWGPSIGKGTHAEGMEQPLKYFVPSIAPCGLLVYSGKLFKEWRGDFISGALVLKHLNRVTNNGKKEERYLEDLKQRVRNVVELPDGRLVIATDSGKIISLAP